MTKFITVVRSVGIGTVLLIVGVLLACTSAAPSACIQAAQDAGLSDGTLEQLRNPGDLNALERAALNRVLTQAGIDDVCQIASDGTASTSEADDDSSGSGLRNINPFNRKTEERSTPEADQPKSADTNEVEVAGSAKPPIQQTIATQREARIAPNDEHRRRCKFWALNNLQPVVYAEFSKLDPDDMDDLDRILWRSHLYQHDRFGHYDYRRARHSDTSQLLLPQEPGIYCRDYWAEPIRRSNANLRNHGL